MRQPMTPWEDLGRHLRELREDRDMTQKDVSDRLGYSTAQFISNWERGRSRPPYDVIGRLAVIFGVTSKSLVELVFQAEDRVVQLKKQQVLKELRA